MYEALPGVLGNRGTRTFISYISGEQKNNCLKMRGTGEQARAILGNKEQRKSRF